MSGELPSAGAGHMVLDVVELCEVLPRTPKGEVNRARLAQYGS